VAVKLPTVKFPDIDDSRQFGIACGPPPRAGEEGWLETASVSDARQAGTAEPDAAGPRFRQLEQARARKRHRRRRRLIVAAVLFATLAGAGMLGLAASRAPSSEPAGDARPPTPLENATLENATHTVAPGESVAPELPPRPAAVSAPPSVLAPPRLQRPNLDFTPPLRVPPDEPRTAASASPRHAAEAAPVRVESAEADDATAVIDWLLTTSRRSP
jgi:hypothetical protein